MTTVKLEAWERPVQTVLPYLMLAFCASITVLLRSTLGGRWLTDLAMCLVAAAWLVGMTWLVPARWRRLPAVQASSFAGLIAIMTVMIALSPWFGFFTFTGYFWVAEFPHASWRVLAVVAVAVLTGSSEAGGFATAAHGTGGAAFYAGVVGVNVLIAGSLTLSGWLGAVQHQRRGELVEELSSANERLKTTLAENAELHQRLLEQARENGVRDERQRMAREIHDTLAQGLAGIITQLQAAAEAASDSVEHRRHHEAAMGLARDSLTEARRSVHALRPMPLEGGSPEGARLPGALSDVAARWSALHRVPVEVATTGASRALPADWEVALLRMAQEGLANVGKHAAASHAWLTLSYMEDVIVLDVSDDGCGFDASVSASEPETADVSAGGFGLTAMRQRVEALGGKLEVESSPGSGTTISASVPAPRSVAS